MTAIDWDTLIQNSAGSFDPLPDDTYNTVIVETQAGQSGNQKPMIKAKFRVEDGPHANRSLWNNFVISAESGNALSFFFQHMGVFGMPEQWFKQYRPTMEQVAETMLNKRCRLKTTIRSWNGQQRNNVAAVMPPLGPGQAAAPAMQPGGAPVMQPGGQFPQPQPGIPQGFPQPQAQPQPQQQPQPQPPLTPQQPSVPQPQPQPQQQHPQPPAPPQVPPQAPHAAGGSAQPQYPAAPQVPQPQYPATPQVPQPPAPQPPQAAAPQAPPQAPAPQAPAPQQPNLQQGIEQGLVEGQQQYAQQPPAQPPAQQQYQPPTPYDPNAHSAQIAQSVIQGQQQQQQEQQQPPPQQVPQAPQQADGQTQQAPAPQPVQPPDDPNQVPF